MWPKNENMDWRRTGYLNIADKDDETNCAGTSLQPIRNILITVTEQSVHQSNYRLYQIL